MESERRDSNYDGNNVSSADDGSLLLPRAANSSNGWSSDEEAPFMENSANSIAVIVTWFGGLPGYWPYWLKTAEANKSIDVHVFSDCDIRSSASNIIVHRTTFDSEISRCRSMLNREVTIAESYKFCDCRPFFGLIYADYLGGYDFWGYCDIDLAFGSIRDFVTDDILAKHDRIYQYGHFCLFRNNEKINHLIELPGCIYSMDEIFLGKAKTTPEEYFGLNRVCMINDIPWYTRIDFGDFRASICDRLEVGHVRENYENQVFYWEDGKAKRAFLENGDVQVDEWVYLHWQKKKPAAEPLPDECLSFFILSDRLIPRASGIPTVEEISSLNCSQGKKIQKHNLRKYYRGKVKDFLLSELAEKKIASRQYRYRLFEGKKRRKYYL